MVCFSFGVIPLDYISECESLSSPINTLTEANDQKGFAKRVLNILFNCKHSCLITKCL